MKPEQYFGNRLNDLTEPKPCGGFRFPGDAKVWINTFTKPNWFHRLTMRVVFGFQWQRWEEYDRSWELPR